MSVEGNIELVRSGYAAFSTRDMATLQGLFAEDAVWNYPGNEVLSGPKKGRDAILAFFGEIMVRSNGTFAVSVVDIAGNEERVFTYQHTDAEREGKLLNRYSVNVSGGVVTELEEFFQDTAESDAFRA